MTEVKSPTGNSVLRVPQLDRLTEALSKILEPAL